MSTVNVHHHETHPLLSTSDDEPLFAPAQSFREGARSLRTLDWRQALGGISVLLGLLTLVGGWFGIARSTQTYEQLTYLLSGGFGGLGLIGVGAIFLIGYEHYLDRGAIARMQHRLDELEAIVRNDPQPLDRRRSRP